MKSPDYESIYREENDCHADFHRMPTFIGSRNEIWAGAWDLIAKADQIAPKSGSGLTRK
jgi:hypothetical protein